MGLARDFDFRGNQFIPFKDLSSFEKLPGGHTNESVFLSPEITTGIHWNELIVSWNTKMFDSSYLKLEARAIYPERSTKYYTMAFWSGDPNRNPRESTPHQKDSDGDVSTDTLALKKPSDRLQIRVTLGGEGGHMPELKFLGLCLTDTGTTLHVRKTFPRKNFITAWAHSKNAVYLVYPESMKVPEDRFAHWNSSISRERIKLDKSE